MRMSERTNIEHDTSTITNTTTDMNMIIIAKTFDNFQTTVKVTSPPQPRKYLSCKLNEKRPTHKSSRKADNDIPNIKRLLPIRNHIFMTF